MVRPHAIPFQNSPFVKVVIMQSFLLSFIFRCVAFFEFLFCCQLPIDNLHAQEVASLSAELTARRTRTENTGKFKTDAQLLSVSDSAVVLRRSDGKEITIPLERISAFDRDCSQFSYLPRYRDGY